MGTLRWYEQRHAKDCIRYEIQYHAISQTFKGVVTSLENSVVYKLICIKNCLFGQLL